MNVPTKFLKSNELSSDKVQFYSKISGRYSNSFKKYKKASRVIPHGEAFRNEVLSWFFSLDLITKMIVCSIESKWASHILHQLYIHQRYEPELRYQCRQERDDFSNITFIGEPYYLPRGSTNVISDVYHFLNYFSMKSEGYLSLSLKENKYTYGFHLNIQESFLNEIKFYKSEEIISNSVMTVNNIKKFCNYFTLTEKILQDEDLFKYYFDKLSKGHYMTSPIKTNHDVTSKTSSIDLPDWASGNKDAFFTVSELFAAFFEQVISVRYILYHDCKDNLADLFQSSYLNQILNKKNDLVNFLKEKNFISLPDEKLFDYLKLTQLGEELYYETKVEEFVEAKLYRQKSNRLNYNSRLIFDKGNAQLSTVMRDVKNYFRGFQSEEEFIDKLIFININKVFTYDDIFLRRVLETIINNHSQQITDDLMNDLDTNKVMVEDSGKGKKKKKKKNMNNQKSTTGNVQCENGKLQWGNSRSYGQDIITHTYTQIDINEEDQIIGDIVREVVQSILDAICNETSNCNSICNCNNQKNYLSSGSEKESTTNANQMEPETTYSSENDNLSGIVHQKKAAKKKNKFFLYDTKPKKGSISNSAESITISTPAIHSKEHGMNNPPKETSAPPNLKISPIPICESPPNLTSRGEGGEKTSVNSQSINQISKFDIECKPMDEVYCKAVRPLPINNKFSKHSNNEHTMKSNGTYINSMKVNIYNQPIYLPSNVNCMNGRYLNMFDMPAFCRPIPNFFKNSPFCSNSYFLIHHNPISFDFFYLKLHKDIVDYSTSVESILAQAKPIKLQVIEYLRSRIAETLPQVEVEVYGSFASELDIESSDIDISIKINDPKSQVEVLMSSLAKSLAALNIFDVVNPIYTASVPVIKITLDPMKVVEKEIKCQISSEKYKTYPFDKEELEKIRIDLTFTLQSTEKSLTQLQVNYIKNTLLSYPEIKPIIRIMKRILQLKRLNCSFKGGLSSFPLFLMILAYCKIHRMNRNNSIGVNSGKLLIEILLHYGSFFDFNCTIIDTNLDNPYVVYPDIIENVPTILDPVSYFNAGKSSYRIKDITKLFSQIYEMINSLKVQYDKKLIPIEENAINVLLTQII